MDSTLPGSSVHGILQARILAWVAIPSPGDLPNPGTEGRSPTLQAYSLPVELPGKPHESLRQRNQVLVSHVSTILKQAIFKIRIVPTIPPLVRNTGELEFSHSVTGNANRYSHSFYETTCSYKEFYVYVHSKLICNNQTRNKQEVPFS